jgi:hypothetical protein
LHADSPQDLQIFSAILYAIPESHPMAPTTAYWRKAEIIQEFTPDSAITAISQERSFIAGSTHGYQPSSHALHRKEQIPI